MQALDKEKRIDKVITELDKNFLFWGNIPDTLGKYELYDRKSIKEVLDYLDNRKTPLPKGLRSFVYDQMRLRNKNYNHIYRDKLKKVI